MTDRRTHQTILLLNTLLDALPAPPTWTGNLQQRSTLPGPAPSRWQHCDSCNTDHCETCHGAGQVFDRFNRPTQCAQCDGHGKYKIDDYTNQRISTLEHGLITHHTTVRCDRCDGDGVWKFNRCQLCEGTGRRSTTPRDLNVAHEQTRKRDTTNLWGKDGSYHELDHALNNLRATSQRACLQVWRVHVERTLDPDQASQPLLKLSLVFIVTRMPTPILVPAGLHTAEKRAQAHQLKTKGRHTDPRARAARDSEIRKLHRHGKPVQWIAQQTGLSVSSVYDILADRMKETAA